MGCARAPAARRPAHAGRPARARAAHGHRLQRAFPARDDAPADAPARIPRRRRRGGPVGGGRTAQAGARALPRRPAGRGCGSGRGAVRGRPPERGLRRTAPARDAGAPAELLPTARRGGDLAPGRTAGAAVSRRRPGRLWLFFYGRRGFPGLLVGLLGLAVLLGLAYGLPGGADFSRWVILVSAGALLLLIVASLALVVFAWRRPRGRR